MRSRMPRAYGYAIDSALAEMRRPGALQGVNPFSLVVLADWSRDSWDTRLVADLVSDLDTAQRFLLYIANRDELQTLFGAVLPESESVGGPRGGTDAGRLRGTGGDDTLQGRIGAVSDTFDADAGGSDTLDGGLGDDTYQLGLGTGDDTIDEGLTGGGTDRILVEAISGADGVELERTGDDLLVRLLEDGSVLRVKGHFASNGASRRVERLEFARGGTLSLVGLGLVDGGKVLVADRLARAGTQGADTLTGSSGSSTTFGPARGRTRSTRTKRVPTDAIGSGWGTTSGRTGSAFLGMATT